MQIRDVDVQDDARKNSDMFFTFAFFFARTFPARKQFAYLIYKHEYIVVFYWVCFFDLIQIKIKFCFV